jgi:asparagine synthase (glutamine-hydrolysing)
LCGIVGFLSKKYLKHIHLCLKSIEHRGPDDSGIFYDDNVVLGFQRLSIIELSELGHQPMTSNDGNLIIIFNGEIYNHLDLRKSINTDYSFKSRSDTETVLAGYQKFGKSFFKQLNGIFSIAIYNKLEKKIILARDHFGVKPLYYYYKDGHFLFSSEMKALLKIPQLDKSIDHNSITNYIHYLYSPGNNTPLLFFKKFPSGSFLEINLNKRVDKLVFEKFYRIPFKGSYKISSEKEAIEKIDFHLRSSIKKQLLSDVPIGYFLSGGLDSSLIVAIARDLNINEIDCFTIRSNHSFLSSEGFSDDLKYAEIVSKHLGVNLHKISGEIDILDDFDKMIYFLDEPQADIAPLHIYNISKYAKKIGYKVLMGGAGGDDLFSGYRRHQAILWDSIISKIPKIGHNLIQGLEKMNLADNSNFRRFFKLVKYSNKSQLDRMVGYYEWISYKKTYNLFNKDIKKSLGSYHPNSILKELLKEIPNEKNLLNQMLFLELSFFLKDHNLNYTDKLSMAAGVEVRVPYLDYDLVNLSTEIHPSLKLKKNATKYILKKVAEKYLPKKVIYRSKSGFGGPIRHWVKNDLSELINEYLGPEKIKTRGLFDPSSVWKLIQDNQTGKIDASYNIWSLLAIESWFRQFVD